MRKITTSADPMVPNPAVDRAEAALRAFGDVVDRDVAANLLAMWRYARNLTPAETAQVLRRFPLPETTVLAATVYGYSIRGRE